MLHHVEENTFPCLRLKTVVVTMCFSISITLLLLWCTAKHATILLSVLETLPLNVSICFFVFASVGIVSAVWSSSFNENYSHRVSGCPNNVDARNLSHLIGRGSSPLHSWSPLCLSMPCNLSGIHWLAGHTMKE